MNPSATLNLLGRRLGFGYRFNTVSVALDVLPIPLTAEYVNKTLGTDAEALTLADGLFEGQPLTIAVAATFGGLGTLTPETATGWTAAYLNKVGDRLRLRWVNATIGWVIEEYYRAPGLGSAVAVDADALVIPVTHETVAKTTGADAEACTLADGAYLGQKLRIHLVADGGGAATVTPTTPLHFATFVLADVKDTVDLVWNNAWQIVNAYGTAAPPAIT